MDNCDQMCSNTMGSFECRCNPGYTLADERRSSTCIDIDECALDLHNCQQECINTVGGFGCACFTGYELNTDQVTCSGKRAQLAIMMTIILLCTYQYFSIPGTGSIFSLLNSTNVLLVEGTTITVCIELNNIESLDQTNYIRVTYEAKEQRDEGKNSLVSVTTNVKFSHVFACRVRYAG